MNELNSLSPTFQSLYDFSQDSFAGQQPIDLTPAQQMRVLTILSEVDLTSRQTRQNLIQEIGTNPTIARIVHSTICSLNQANKNDEPYFTLDAELNQAIFDALQEAVNRDSARALNEWLMKFGAYFDRQTIDSLETYDLFSLAALIAKSTQLIKSGHPHADLLKVNEFRHAIFRNLPDLARNYYELICMQPQEKYLFMQISQSIGLESLEREAEYIAFANYICVSRIPIRRLGLDEKTLLTLAPYLRYADLSDLNADLITQILEKSTKLTQLVINSKSIKSLPDMPALQRLNCQRCTSLRALPEMPVLKQLFCEGCTRLESLPEEMLALDYLNCEGCTLLESLPQRMPALQVLICRNATGLQSLPEELSALQHLDCNRCTSLQGLPQLMRALRRLHCNGCTNLQSLPLALPVLLRLECAECDSLNGNMPEMPPNAVVIAENSPMEFLKLEVDVNEIASRPKKILLQLGQEHLLHNKPFPNIYYYENGQLSEVVDAGGVRRDFISRLMESLFVQSDAGNDNLLVDRFGTPFKDDQKNTDKAYETLGRIFALCYPEDSFFKTGQLFESEVYRRIACMPGQVLENQSDEELVSLYQRYMNMPAEVAEVINNPQSNNVLNEKILAHLNALVDLADEEINTDVQEFLQIPQNRANLKSAIKNEVLESKSIQALNSIAIGIRDLLGEPEWANFCTHDAGMLHDRIEGSLSKEKLLEKIKWRKSESVSEEQLKNVEVFITDWIERANLEILRKFVRAVTANNTLGKDKLKLEVYSRGPDFIPVAHTCFFTLELSGEYPNQKHFDNKLDLLITEGMAGGGFQIA